MTNIELDKWAAETVLGEFAKPNAIHAAMTAKET